MEVFKRNVTLKLYENVLSIHMKSVFFNSGYPFESQVFDITNGKRTSNVSYYKNVFTVFIFMIKD